MKLNVISSFKPGQTIHGFYICKDKQFRNTRNGDSYLDIILQDKSGSISGKIWNDIEYFAVKFNISDPVAVKGKVENYNSRIQLIVQQINRAEPHRYSKYGFNVDELIPTISEPVADLWKILIKAVKFLKKPYKEIIKSLLSKYEYEIQMLPASVSHHHSVCGGFLKHIVSSIQLGMSVHKLYPGLDRSLLISGIILHDIGKVKGINFTTKAEQTDSGKLLGDIQLGCTILDEITQDMDIDQIIFLKLKHMILSYQGSSATGYSIKPKFPEALIVYYIAKMDGQLEMMQREISEDLNSDWTSRFNYFNQELWKK